MSSSRSALILQAVLHVFKPLARLLLRNGVAYPAFAAALKQVFLDAAVQELRSAGKKQTDSAISLLSGVHRRDVRTLGRLAPERLAMDDAPMNMASEVVFRWLSQPEYLDTQGEPRVLPRTGDAQSFDALVGAISSDVRPRAVLDELVRLGIAAEVANEVRLEATGFAPRQGLAEMAALMQANLHDHAAAACLNMDGTHNYLEQALFVDQLTLSSVRRLQGVSARAWNQALKPVMREAQAQYDHDQVHASPHERVYRIRFGSYFYAADQNDQASP